MKYLIFMMTFLMISCAPQVEEVKTSLSIRMPKSDRSKRNSARYTTKNVAATGTFGLADITTLDDIDCYAVGVGFSKSGVNPALSGTCGNETTEFRNIHLVSQTVPDGGTIEINDVPIGPDRTVYVFGFSHSSNGSACPDFRHIQPAEYANMSAPVMVGKTTQDLIDAAENDVEVTIQTAGSTKLNGCRHSPFTWAVTGVFNETKFENAVFGP